MSDAALASAPAASTLLGKQRSWILVIVFSVLTLGIYGIYWWIVTLEDIKKHGKVGTGGIGILVFLIPLGALVMWFLLPSWIGQMNQAESREPDTTGATGCWIFLPIAGPFVYYARVQNSLNRHWAAHGG